MMLNAIITENKLPFTEHEVQFLHELINPYEHRTDRLICQDKPFLYEVVANARNSVDVDKVVTCRISCCHAMTLPTQLILCIFACHSGII
jgi:hypothetical protein